MYYRSFKKKLFSRKSNTYLHWHIFALTHICIDTYLHCSLSTFQKLGRDGLAPSASFHWGVDRGRTWCRSRRVHRSSIAAHFLECRKRTMQICVNANMCQCKYVFALYIPAKIEVHVARGSWDYRSFNFFCLIVNPTHICIDTHLHWHIFALFALYIPAIGQQWTSDGRGATSTKYDRGIRLSGRKHWERVHRCPIAGM